MGIRAIVSPQSLSFGVYKPKAMLLTARRAEAMGATLI